MLSWFCERMGYSVTKDKMFAFIVLVFAFYPNHYEVIYWPFAMGYIVGALLMALGLISKDIVMRSVLFCGSFLISEMFFGPAFLLLLAPVLLKTEFKGRFAKTFIQNTLYELRGWFFSALLYGAVRYIFALKLGFFPYPIDLSWEHLSDAILSFQRYYWYIHFFKTNWISTILEIGAWSFVLIYLFYLKLFSQYLYCRYLLILLLIIRLI